jgi:hypothetical protein
MNKKFEHRWKWDFLNIIGKVELVPVSWLMPYMISNPAYKTTDTHGNPVDLKELKAHIFAEGLHHSGVIEVNRQTKIARIVAGNHRLMIAEELIMPYFPFYVIIRDVSNLNLEGGIDSTYNVTSVVDATVGDVVETPSNVFVDLANKALRF